MDLVSGGDDVVDDLGWLARDVIGSDHEQLVVVLVVALIARAGDGGHWHFTSGNLRMQVS